MRLNCQLTGLNAEALGFGLKEEAFTLSLNAAEAEEFCEAVGEAGAGMASICAGEFPFPLLLAEFDWIDSDFFLKGGIFWMTMGGGRPLPEGGGSALVVGAAAFAVLVELDGVAARTMGDADAAGRRV
jgi:hypothetical protein